MFPTGVEIGRYLERLCDWFCSFNFHCRFFNCLNKTDGLVILFEDSKSLPVLILNHNTSAKISYNLAFFLLSRGQRSVFFSPQEQNQGGSSAQKYILLNKVTEWGNRIKKVHKSTMI